MTSFSIAVNRNYTKAGQERPVDFLDIVAWRSTAEFICRYFQKGRAILVEGAIQTRSYTDKQGNNRRAWEVVADSVHFVENKQGGGASAPPMSDGSAQDFTELDDFSAPPF